jgi:hypothetical protein
VKSLQTTDANSSPGPGELKIKTYISNFSLHDEFLEQPSSGGSLSKAWRAK